jgi:ABC-2 type transport system ATP-binding protein
MIEVRNLVKHYGTTEALRGVSFTVQPGEAVGYLGPNGAGKSTTVKILAGLVQPDGGSVRIGGHDLSDNPLEAKRRLGYVPETAALYTSLTPHEYLSLVAELHELDRAAAAERIGQLLKVFDITETADRQIETLSKGQRQKVLLIGALLHDPDVLLLDEPLGGLDVHACLALRRILDSLRGRGKAILFCSHVLEVIERLCQRVIVLDRGRVVADDSTAHLLARAPEGTLEAVFRTLTRKNEADESVQAFLDALATAP